MYYTIYKITNIKNDKIYIGMHKTKDLNDNYMGSGLNIRRAIKKYGIDNFKKEYINIFDNEEEMINLESNLVNKEFLNDKNTYNIMEGGKGGFDYINSNIFISKEEKSEMMRKFGGWKNKEKRRKVWESVPIEKRKKIAQKMGIDFGGRNKLDDNEIKERLSKIIDIDLMKHGWVKKVSLKLNISHTQVKRFIDKYYNGEYYRRNKI